jgi:predicted ATPase with chaperone activity
MYLRACAGDEISKADIGPLLDRIDIHIEVPRVNYEKLSGDRVSESSESIRARVQAARDIQNTRFSGNASSDIVCNADMRVGEIRQFAGCRPALPKQHRDDVSAVEGMRVKA